jgi:hypothetical protein
MADELFNYDTNPPALYQSYSQPPPPIVTPTVVGGDVNIVTTINGATGHITFDGAAIGVGFTGAQGGTVTMSISNPTLFRTAISAAKSGINTDISQLNGASQVDVSGVYKVDGVQVVTEQQPAVPDASGGVTVDVEARTAVNALLAALRTHGLISP